jgi:6-phosphogluconolactonase
VPAPARDPVLAVLLLLSVTTLSCGGGPSSSHPPPPSMPSEFLYVTGTIPGNQTQIFGYEIHNDGTLGAIALSSLTSPYCCHGAASAGSVLYVADFGSGMAAFTVDQKGGLTALDGSPFSGLTGGANGSPVICGKKFLYATNGSPGSVFAFSIASSGALSPSSGSPFATGQTPGTPVADSSCRFLFVPNGNGGALRDASVFAYTVDASSGKLNAVSGSPFSVGAGSATLLSAAADTTGRFLYVPVPDRGVVAAFSIDGSAVLTSVAGSPFTTGKAPVFSLVMSVSSQQFLYVANQGANNVSVFSIDSSTGNLSLRSQFATPGAPTFLAATAGFLYSFNVAANSVSIYSVNQDGSVTTIPHGLSLAYTPASATVVTMP